MVTRKDNEDITNIITILTAMSDAYGSKQTDPAKFQLFNSTKYSGTNLLFKDSSTALVAIAKDNQTYQGFLGDDYVKDTEALKSCDFMKSTTSPSLTTVVPTAVSTMATANTLLMLFIALSVFLVVDQNS